MAKRKSDISLSFVLLRFAFVLLGSMLLCLVAFLALQTGLERAGLIYHGSVSNQQAEAFLAEKPQEFLTPGEDFLPFYALFDSEGQILETNASLKEQKQLKTVFSQGSEDVDFLSYVYPDSDTLILHWYYRREFINPALRHLPFSFEALWWTALCISWILCLFLHTLHLKRYLTDRLRLFAQVSRKISVRELDFPIPHAGIREYDQALLAMEHMRDALYTSLSSQWSAQQERETEMAALAHDLKTPLTLIGGNAELLLEENLSQTERNMAETILSANTRAVQYVPSLLELSKGAEESFSPVELSALFEELCQNARTLAESKGVYLKTESNLKGQAVIQKERLLRAFLNTVLNAVEHTPRGKTVSLTGCMTGEGWELCIYDQGKGFSQEALLHGTERLWQGDSSRSSASHHGLGLWFAAQAAKNHGGTVLLRNGNLGGIVTFSFCQHQI